MDRQVIRATCTVRVVLGVLLAVAVVVATAPRSCCVRARREYARVGLREDPECARLVLREDPGCARLLVVREEYARLVVREECARQGPHLVARQV